MNKYNSFSSTAQLFTQKRGGGNGEKGSEEKEKEVVRMEGWEK